MGKIYRIPIPKRLGLIDLKNRRHVLLYGIGLVIVTLVVGLSVGSTLTEYAVELLSLGLIMIFFIGLFWEDWSTQTTRTLVLLSIVLSGVCLFVGTMRTLTIFTPELGLESLTSHYDSEIRNNVFLIIPELLPILIPVCAFILCARGALIEEYESDA